MNRDTEKTLLFVGIAAILGFFIWKQGKKRGSGDNAAGDITDIECNSANSDENCESIAKRLRIILDYWYVSSQDELEVVSLFNKILDECGYRKVYALFGTLSNYTTSYTPVDLDTMIGHRISESNKAKIRKTYNSF